MASLGATAQAFLFCSSHLPGAQRNKINIRKANWDVTQVNQVKLETFLEKGEAFREHFNDI